MKKHSLLKTFAFATTLLAGCIADHARIRLAEAGDRYNVGPVETLKLKTPKKLFFENPVLNTTLPDGRHIIGLSALYSTACMPQQGLDAALTQKFDLKSNCAKIDQGEVYGGQHSILAGIYASVFDRKVIDGASLLTFVHTEELNINTKKLKHTNRIAPDIRCEKTGWYNCWPSYFAAMMATRQSFDAATSPIYDKKVVVWPRKGYYDRNNQVKLSDGTRHGGFLDASDGYVYAYYLDGSVDEKWGKIVTARISKEGLKLDDWYNHFQTNCDGIWVKALPEGMTQDNIEQFLGTSGGCSSPTIPDPRFGSQVRFYAEKSEQGGYVGVLQTMSADYQDSQIVLFKSYDAINWSEPQVVVSAPGNWAAAGLNYPVIYRADMTMGPVNEHDFKVGGVSAEVGNSGGKTHENVLTLGLRP